MAKSSDQLHFESDTSLNCHVDRFELLSSPSKSKKPIANFLDCSKVCYRNENSKCNCFAVVALLVLAAVVALVGAPLFAARRHKQAQDEPARSRQPMEKAEERELHTTSITTGATTLASGTASIQVENPKFKHLTRNKKAVSKVVIPIEKEAPTTKHSPLLARTKLAIQIRKHSTTVTTATGTVATVTTSRGSVAARAMTPASRDSTKTKVKTSRGKSVTNVTVTRKKIVGAIGAHVKTNLEEKRVTHQLSATVPTLTRKNLTSPPNTYKTRNLVKITTEASTETKMTGDRASLAPETTSTVEPSSGHRTHERSRTLNPDVAKAVSVVPLIVIALGIIGCFKYQQSKTRKRSSSLRHNKVFDHKSDYNAL